MGKITCKEIVKRVEDAIEKEGLKCHISKNGEWGYNRFVDGKENTICLGSFNPDTYNKAFSIVQEVVKDTPYSASKDNYYTIFVDAPKPIEESFEKAYNDSASLERFLRDNNYTDYEIVDYQDYPMNISLVVFRVDGDWKHDHLYIDHLIREWAQKHNRYIYKIEKEEIGHSDSDWYEAYHKVFIADDKDTIDILTKLSNEFIESLGESVYSDLVAKPATAKDLTNHKKFADKRKKGLSPFSYLKPNAGNVLYNLAMFNHALGSGPMPKEYGDNILNTETTSNSDGASDAQGSAEGASGEGGGDAGGAAGGGAGGESYNMSKNKLTLDESLFDEGIETREPEFRRFTLSESAFKLESKSEDFGIELDIERLINSEDDGVFDEGFFFEDGGTIYESSNEQDLNEVVTVADTPEAKAARDALATGKDGWNITKWSKDTKDTFKTQGRAREITQWEPKGPNKLALAVYLMTTQGVPNSPYIGPVRDRVFSKDVKHQVASSANITDLIRQLADAKLINWTKLGNRNVLEPTQFLDEFVHTAHSPIGNTLFDLRNHLHSFFSPKEASAAPGLPHQSNASTNQIYQSKKVRDDDFYQTDNASLGSADYSAQGTEADLEPIDYGDYADIPLIDLDESFEESDWTNKTRNDYKGRKQEFIEKYLKSISADKDYVITEENLNEEVLKTVCCMDRLDYPIVRETILSKE